MMEIIKKLFSTCKHEYETINSRVIRIYEDEYDTMPCAHEYIEIQRCKKCGKIRKQTIKY